MDICESTSSPEVVTEAIVVIDLVDSTRTSNLFGWSAVGRGLLRDLRTLNFELPHSVGACKAIMLARRVKRCFRGEGWQCHGFAPNVRMAMAYARARQSGVTTDGATAFIDAPL